LPVRLFVSARKYIQLNIQIALLMFIGGAIFLFQYDKFENILL